MALPSLAVTATFILSNHSPILEFLLASWKASQPSMALSTP